MTLVAGRQWAGNVAAYETRRDRYFASVEILLHMEGTDGGTTFTDVKGHTVTSSGSGITTSTTAPKFGSSSLSSVSLGATDRLMVAGIVPPGTGDFTVEAWVKLVSDPLGRNWVIAGIAKTGPNISFSINNGVLRFVDPSTGTSFSGSTSLTPGIWYHVAFVRSGANRTLFLNGIIDGTASAVSSDYDITDMAICNHYTTPSTTPFNGFIDEFRYTRIARYTSSFTPPSAAYPDA